MRRALSILLAISAAACQGKAVTPSARPSAAVRPPVPAAKLLAKPATPSTTLSGVVALDAGYLITNDGGSVISTDGSSIVATGGGNIVATGGGNVVAVAKGAVIGNDGGSIISNDGASIVASGAGNLIIADADAVLAADGLSKRFQLLETPSGAAQLPAAGMWLRAVSLLDGTALPLGVDAAGKPVYVVATDAKGRFTIYLPTDLAGNVRLVASVPHATDAHLTYAHVLPAAPAKDLALDEGHALVSDFLQRTLEDRILESLGAGDPLAVEAFKKLTDTPGFQAALADIRTQAEAAGFASLAPAARIRMAGPFARLLLANVGLPGAPGVDGQVQELVEGVMDEITAKAGALAPAELAALQTRPWAVVANRLQALKGRPTVSFKKATDVASLLAQAYLGNPAKLRKYELAAALRDMGLARERVDALDASMDALATQLDVELAKLGADNSLQLVAAVKRELGASPAPAPSALPDPPLPTAAPNAGDVTTLAGSGKAEDVDGNGVEAGLVSPVALALDGQRLYVGEDGGAIRLIDLADPLHPVTTLVPTSGGAQDLDGPAKDARFKAIRALAVVGTKLFIGAMPRKADFQLGQGGVIKVLDLADPDHRVTTVVGKLGEGGFTPGPGAQARLAQPAFFAVDPHGDLTVSDPDFHALYKLDLHGGSYELSLLAGMPTATPKTLGNDGPAKEIMLAAPLGVAYDKAGTLYLDDVRWLRRLGPDGWLRVVAGGVDAQVKDGYWMEGNMGDVMGLAALPDGDLLVGEFTGHRLRRVRLDAAGRGGVVSVAAGPEAPTTAEQSVDGKGPAARFGTFYNVVTDGQGTAYVSEIGTHRIRQVKF